MVRLDENLRRQPAVVFRGQAEWMRTATVGEALMEISKLSNTERQQMSIRIGPPARTITYEEFKDDIVERSS
jgi:hypothetical protein